MGMGVICGHELGQDWYGVSVMNNKDCITMMTELTVLGLLSKQEKNLAEYMMHGFAIVAEAQNCNPRDLLSDMYNKEMLLEIFKVANSYCVEKIKNTNEGNASKEEVAFNISVFKKTLLEIQRKVETGELVIAVNRARCLEMLESTETPTGFFVDKMQHTHALVKHGYQNFDDLENEQLLSIALIIRKIGSINLSITMLESMTDDDELTNPTTDGGLDETVHVLSDKDMTTLNRASYHLN